jgi:tRNA(Ile)-lysidine synthase
MQWELFLSRLHQSIDQTLPSLQDASVLVAVSGGIDSTLLLEGLAGLRTQLQLSRLGAVYVDHGLRPEDTPTEAAAVLQRAHTLGAQGYVRHIQFTRQNGSLQDAARNARRQALLQLADQEQWTWIATGHHRDDQVETMLQRLLRGTTSDGLAGIAPRIGPWLRPFLSFSRADIEETAQQYGITWLEDPSNQKRCYNRNQIRHDLLPLLEQTYNPNLRPQLARMATQIREDVDYFRQALTQYFVPPLAQQTDDGWHLDLRHWSTLHPALQWRVIRHAIQQTYQQSLPRKQIDHIIDLTHSHTGKKQASLPAHMRVIRRYHQLSFLYPTSTVPDASHASSMTIRGPGSYTTPWGTLHVTSTNDHHTTATSHWSAFWPSPHLPQLTLRTRQPGDVLQLEHGRKTLKKWLIDAKIPQTQRHTLPLLEHDGSICWIIGHRRAFPLQREPSPDGWHLTFVPEET